MSWRFHATAPPGEWINDPNALFFANGRYHLYVQHAADAPAFKRIGWGHLSSPNLQDWRWDGLVMPPEERASIYSGSLAVEDGKRHLFYTRHDLDGPWQSQRCAVVSPDLASASIDPGEVGPAGRNVRDPFLYRVAEGWRMLIAAPCDWTDWRSDPPSSLELWGSPDIERWSKLANIGPWTEPGVMWEVPALLDLGGVQALLLSLVDRRSDLAECQVRYWLGRLSDDGFARSPGFPEEGVPLDLGPDFYAAIPNTAAGWPDEHRVVVGWASNWRTARAIDWPEGRGGGPISMPRRVLLDGDRLVVSQGIDRAPDWSGELACGDRLRVGRKGAELALGLTEHRIIVERIAEGLPAFVRQHARAGGGSASVSAFVDAGLIELFIDGQSITAFLPGAGGAKVRHLHVANGQ